MLNALSSKTIKIALIALGLIIAVLVILNFLDPAIAVTALTPEPEALFDPFNL